MTREQAQMIVQEAILDHLDITPGKYQLTDTLSSLGANSLDEVQVMMLIEDRLDIKHLEGAEKLSSIRTVNDVIALVEKVTTTIQ